MEKLKISPDSSRHLLHPKLTVLVTSISEDENPNIITIAWAMPVSIEPSLLAVSIGKDRHSHDIISDSGEFGVNIPEKNLLEEVKTIGSKSGSTFDKFSKTGLTKGEAEKIHAPLIEECVASIECEVVDQCEAGDHTLFIGRIVSGKVDSEVFDQEEDIFDTDRFEPIFHIGGPNFVTSGEEIS